MEQLMARDLEAVNVLLSEGFNNKQAIISDNSNGMLKRKKCSPSRSTTIVTDADAIPPKLVTDHTILPVGPIDVFRSTSDHDLSSKMFHDCRSRIPSTFTQVTNSSYLAAGQDYESEKEEMGLSCNSCKSRVDLSRVGVALNSKISSSAEDTFCTVPDATWPVSRSSSALEAKSNNSDRSSHGTTSSRALATEQAESNASISSSENSVPIPYILDCLEQLTMMIEHLGSQMEVKQEKLKQYEARIEQLEQQVSADMARSLGNDTTQNTVFYNANITNGTKPTTSLISEDRRREGSEDYGTHCSRDTSAAMTIIRPKVNKTDKAYTADQTSCAKQFGLEDTIEKTSRTLKQDFKSELEAVCRLLHNPETHDTSTILHYPHISGPLQNRDVTKQAMSLLFEPGISAGDVCPSPATKSDKSFDALNTQLSQRLRDSGVVYGSSRPFLTIKAQCKFGKFVQHTTTDIRMPLISSLGVRDMIIRGSAVWMPRKKIKRIEAWNRAVFQLIEILVLNDRDKRVLRNDAEYNEWYRGLEASRIDQGWIVELRFACDDTDGGDLSNGCGRRSGGFPTSFFLSDRLWSRPARLQKGGF